MKFIKCLEGKSCDIWEWTTICLDTISNSMIPKFICSVDWNIFKRFSNILLDFKKAQVRTILFFTITWWTIFWNSSIPCSYLFAIAITRSPISPNAITACFFIIACTILDFIMGNRRNIFEFYLAMNCMFLIYCLDLIESKCSIFEFNFFPMFLNQGSANWSDKNLIFWCASPFHKLSFDPFLKQTPTIDRVNRLHL